MELFSDPSTWRDSEVLLAGIAQYPLSAADFNKPTVQETDLIVLGGCNLNSSQFDCGIRDCDRLSTSSMKSSLLTIYSIESEGSRLTGFGRTPPCTTTSTLSFNLQQQEDVDQDELFHDYHVSSHMINAQDDGPTLVSSPGGSSHFFASGFHIPDEAEEHQPSGPLPYGHAFEGSYPMKIGSCFGSADLSLSAEESSAKTAIKTHALYPYLVSAHINCCQIGAKAADLKIFEEARSKHQHLHSRNNTSSPFSKPELDSIMAWYLGMLLDVKEKVEEPFFIEMEWCDEVLEKLELLGPSISPIPITGWGGEGQPSTGGKEGSAFKTGETKHEAYESSFDKRNGVMMEQWKQDKIVKQWLRSKHDRSEIYTLRGQCKKKRRQGKHPETAREHLVEWFNGHGDWPYPSEEEKQKLAEQTNLEARQINNWFINQRKRHWDSPTKEEIIHQDHQDLESHTKISDLQTFVKDRFYAPMDVFNPSHNSSCSWPAGLT